MMSTTVSNNRTIFGERHSSWAQLHPMRGGGWGWFGASALATSCVGHRTGLRLWRRESYPTSPSSPGRTRGHSRGKHNHRSNNNATPKEGLRAVKVQ